MPLAPIVKVVYNSVVVVSNYFFSIFSVLNTPHVDLILYIYTTTVAYFQIICGGDFKIVLKNKRFYNITKIGIHQLCRIWDTTCIVYFYYAGIKRVY
jgi:hypothetical protein